MRYRRDALFSDRFWVKVARSAACWEWQGCRDPDGYGVMRVPMHRRTNQAERASRIAWWLATGHFPAPDEFIGHVCDNPPCVRNDDVGWYDVKGLALPRRGHLFLCTKVDNNMDRDVKGRTIGPRGTLAGHAKLTDEQVRAIRYRQRTERITHAKLAAEYGVTGGTVTAIITRKTWCHLP